MKTKETSTTREQALTWWNKLTKNQQYKFCLKQSNVDDLLISRQLSSLTGREIEEIWVKETKPNFNAVDRDEDRSASYGFGTGKPNQKQYKQFDESLFKAYIDKFSDEDKLKAFICILNELSTEIQFNAFLATLRKMKLDSQTESNIMTLVALKDI